MPVAERSMAQVIADRAKEEGREEGRREGLRDSLSVIRASRFGEIESSHVARMAHADAETLVQWLTAAANAQSIEEALT